MFKKLRTNLTGRMKNVSKNNVEFYNDRLEKHLLDVAKLNSLNNGRGPLSKNRTKLDVFKKYDKGLPKFKQGVTKNDIDNFDVKNKRLERKIDALGYNTEAYDIKSAAILNKEEYAIYMKNKTPNMVYNSILKSEIIDASKIIKLIKYIYQKILNEGNYDFNNIANDSEMIIKKNATLTFQINNNLRNSINENNTFANLKINIANDIATNLENVVIVKFPEIKKCLKYVANLSYIYTISDSKEDYRGAFMICKEVMRLLNNEIRFYESANLDRNLYSRVGDSNSIFKEFELNIENNSVLSKSLQQNDSNLQRNYNINSNSLNFENKSTPKNLSTPEKKKFNQFNPQSPTFQFPNQFNPQSPYNLNYSQFNEGYNVLRELGIKKPAKIDGESVDDIYEKIEKRIISNNFDEEVTKMLLNMTKEYNEIGFDNSEPIKDLTPSAFKSLFISLCIFRYLFLKYGDKKYEINIKAFGNYLELIPMETEINKTSLKLYRRFTEYMIRLHLMKNDIKESYGDLVLDYNIELDKEFKGKYREIDYEKAAIELKVLALILYYIIHEKKKKEKK